MTVDGKSFKGVIPLEVSEGKSDLDTVRVRLYGNHTWLGDVEYTVNE